VRHFTIHLLMCLSKIFEKDAFLRHFY
jgi:hypothetical protein